VSRLLDGEPTVVTAGVALFEEALAAQAVPVVPVDWRPPLDAPGTDHDDGEDDEAAAKAAAGAIVPQLDPVFKPGRHRPGSRAGA